MSNIAYGPKLGQLINANIGDYYPDALRAFLESYDALVQGSVIDAVSVTSPPSSPNNGDAYIVPSGATGLWATQVNNIAVWTATNTLDGTNNPSPAWVYYTPQVGWQMYSVNQYGIYYFSGSSWSNSITYLTVNNTLSANTVDAAEVEAYDAIIGYLNTTYTATVGETLTVGNAGSIIYNPLNATNQISCTTPGYPAVGINAEELSGNGAMALETLAHGLYASNQLNAVQNSVGGSGQAINLLGSWTDGSGVTSGEVIGCQAVAFVTYGDTVNNLYALEAKFQDAEGTVNTEAAAIHIPVQPDDFGCPTYAIKADGGNTHFGGNDIGSYVQTNADNVFYSTGQYATALGAEVESRIPGSQVTAIQAVANGMQAQNYLMCRASSGSSPLAANNFTAATDGTGLTSGGIYGAFVNAYVEGGDSIQSMVGVHVELDVGGGTITDHATALEVNAFPQGCPTYAIHVIQGDTNLGGDTILGGHLISTNADLAGTVTFVNPNTSTAVAFAQPFTGNNPPIITVSAVGADPNPLGGVWVTYQGSTGAWTGFIVNVTTAPASTATFNYTVIGQPTIV